MELQELFIMEKFDKVTRKLIKINNRGYNHVLDKHFIFKNLALTYKKLNRVEISKYYLNLGLNNIESEKLVSPVEYYELQWLNVELNKDLLSSEQMLVIYEDMHEYYKEIKHKRNEIGVLINIYKLQNKFDEIPNLIYEIDNFEDIDMKDMIKDILQECRTFGDTYYNKAQCIINDMKKDGNYITL